MRDESRSNSDPPPPTLFLSLSLCRWYSAGRTARSTSSEDGSPTGRDLARLPVNTGSVSGSGVPQRRVCMCSCVTHARVCLLSSGKGPNQTLEAGFFYARLLRLLWLEHATLKGGWKKKKTYQQRLLFVLFTLWKKQLFNFKYVKTYHFLGLEKATWPDVTLISLLAQVLTSTCSAFKKQIIFDTPQKCLIMILFSS